MQNPRELVVRERAACRGLVPFTNAKCPSWEPHLSVKHAATSQRRLNAFLPYFPYFPVCSSDLPAPCSPRARRLPSLYVAFPSLCSLAGCLELAARLCSAVPRDDPSRAGPASGGSGGPATPASLPMTSRSHPGSQHPRRPGPGGRGGVGGGGHCFNFLLSQGHGQRSSWHRDVGVTGTAWATHLLNSHPLSESHVLCSRTFLG